MTTTSIPPRILRSSPTGVVDPGELATVAIYGCDDAVRARDTARVAAPDGAELHLDIYPAPAAGSQHGTVVFVGGMSNHALGYADFEYRLSQRGWNVVAVDLQGHGRSSGRRGSFDVQSVVSDMRVAQAYASDRFTGPYAVMGTSLGGYYALLASNAIEAFSCAVSHWIFLPDQPMSWRDRMLRPVALLLNRFAPTVRLPTRGMANWDAVNEDPLLRQRCYDDPLMVWRYEVRGVASGMTYAPERALTDLRVPHLVVIGDRDKMTPATYTRGIFDQLQGEKEWRTIPGAGHMGGLVEHQAAMLDTVEDFLARRCAAAAAVTP